MLPGSWDYFWHHLDQGSKQDMVIPKSDLKMQTIDWPERTFTITGHYYASLLFLKHHYIPLLHFTDYMCVYGRVFTSRARLCVPVGATISFLDV